MNFLINCSNLKKGGGLQVAHSVCNQLGRFQKHMFVVVISSYIEKFEIPNGDNVSIYCYNIKNNFTTIVLGRNRFLDRLVEQYNIDAVLTIFGPSRWIPRTHHLCGFARAQLLKMDTPFFNTVPWYEKLLFQFWTWAFKRCSRVFYTENSYISDILPKTFGNVDVYTVTNFYNQVFDHPEDWKRNNYIGEFAGTTMLTVAIVSSHKNLNIMIQISEILEKQHPDFNFRFVITCSPEEMRVPKEISHHFIFIGTVGISEVPFLYEQCDIMFMPTLIECFSATYAEAMKMAKPIVTTDLKFAHGLCGDAACYYSAIDAESAAEAIYKVATDKKYANLLIENGKSQLQKFDNYEQRADKLVSLLEKISR